ncbi:MAG TPA: cation:proton antiporter [Longimicrobiales bacterium]|nr:cation:proton antiporter [Longimicrobiales bacterium]
MIELAILNDLAWVVMGAATVLLLLRPFGVPPILAFMLTGLLLGPALNVLYVSESLHLFSELGVALLLFVVGLELSLEKIRDLGRPAIIVGVAQVGGMLLLGTSISLLLGFDMVPALFLGLAASFSSTVVVVKLLDRAGELDSLHGRISIGVLLVEDVIVAVVLTLVVGLAGVDAPDGGGARAIAVGLATSILGLLALILAAAAAVRWILPAVFGWLSRSGEALFIASITWAFAFILAAEAFHLSIELGAFVAGVALAQLPYNDQLNRRVHPLVDFFLAIFFVSLGAGMDLGAASAFIPTAILLSLLVSVGAPFLAAFLLTRIGYSGHTAFLSAARLNQVSEFAFILLAVGVGAGIVEPELMSLVGLIGLVTISASAVISPRGEPLYRWLRARDWLPAWLRRPGDEEAPRPDRKGHVVVVGMNTLGRTLVRRLSERGESVVAIDNDHRKLRDLRAVAITGTINDPAVLEHADIERAKLVVSALQIEDVNSMLVYRCAQLGVPISVHAHDPSFAHELLELGADHLMVSKLDGIAPMEHELRRLGVIR